LASVLQRALFEGSRMMPMRDTMRTDKLKPHGFKQPSETPKNVELLTSGEFEVISWLATLGVLIAVILAAAYADFDPAVALVGQFP
jgi:hypothetical protein